MDKTNGSLPLVSIVMAAYNAEKYITETIRSVQSQTFENWQLIVVNDGSTDQTVSIVQRFIESDHRISLISQVNKKQAAARNTGYLASVGKWIIFLDADDLWKPTILETLLRETRNNQGVDVFYTDGWMMHFDSMEFLDDYPTLPGYHSPEAMYRRQFECNYIPIQSALIRREIMVKAGLQDESRLYQGCEDYDYWLRLAKAGASFYGIDEKLFFYRKHESNMSANTLQMLYASVSILIKNYDPLLFVDTAGKVAFKPKVYMLVASLIRHGRKNDAAILLTSLQQIAPGNLNLFFSRLIKYAGVFTYFPAKLAGFIQSLRYNSANTSLVNRHLSNS